MKYIVFFLSLMAASGCVSFHSSNIGQNGAYSIVKGMSKTDFKRKVTSNTPYFVQKYTDGSFKNYHTNDYQSGTMFYCKSIIVTFDRNEFVTSAEYHQDKHAKARCNNYAAQYSSNSRAFSTSLSQNAYSIGESLGGGSHSEYRSPSSPRRCSGDYNCDTFKGEKCLKEKNLSGGLNLSGYCGKVLYHSN